MTRRMFVAAVLTVLCAARVKAAAFEELMMQVPAAMIPETKIAPVQGKVLVPQMLEDSLLSFSILSALPQTDPKTAQWLAGRIPGLETARLKTVPTNDVEAVLQRAVAAQATYLDVFTDPGLGKSNPDVYYLGQDVLNELNSRWISGTLPISGRTKNGQPFQMQALVVGQGMVHILYNYQTFQFDDNGNTYEVNNGGHVSVAALGRADVGVSGVRAHGCMGPFCGWADIQQITKTGPTKSRVKTSRKTVDAPLTPVRRR